MTKYLVYGVPSLEKYSKEVCGHICILADHSVVGHLVKVCAWPATMVCYFVHVKATSPRMPGLSITLFLLAFLFSIMFPGTMFSSGETCTCIKLFTWWKRKPSSIAPWSRYNAHMHIVGTVGAGQGLVKALWWVYSSTALYAASCDALYVLTPF